MHATSTYPCQPEEANLRMIATLRDRYPGVPVGYSGHERGLQISLAAVALGAVAVERHITLDRTMWGSDQAASLEPTGLEHLVRDIRVIEQPWATASSASSRASWRRARSCAACPRCESEVPRPRGLGFVREVGCGVRVAPPGRWQAELSPDDAGRRRAIGSCARRSPGPRSARPT